MSTKIHTLYLGLKFICLFWLVFFGEQIFVYVAFAIITPKFIRGSRQLIGVGVTLYWLRMGAERAGAAPVCPLKMERVKDVSLLKTARVQTASKQREVAFENEKCVAPCSVKKVIGRKSIVPRSRAQEQCKTTEVRRPQRTKIILGFRLHHTKITILSVYK